MESLKDSTLSIVKDELEQKEEPLFNTNEERAKWLNKTFWQFAERELKEHPAEIDTDQNGTIKISWGNIYGFLAYNAKTLGIVRIRHKGEELDKNSLFVWDFERGVYIDNPAFINQMLIRPLKQSIRESEAANIRTALVESPNQNIEQLYFNESTIKYIRCKNYLIQIQNKHFTPLKNDEVDFKPVITLADYWDLNFTPEPVEPTFQLDDGTPFKVSQWIKETVADNDKELEHAFYQILGQCVATETGGKLYIFYSKQTNSGKGTALALVRELVGSKSANVSLDQFNDDKALSVFINKRTNLTDELPKNIRLDKIATRNIKALFGGDGVGVTQLYKDGTIHVDPLNVMVQTSNYIPHASDSAIFEDKRMKVIPFTKKFNKGQEKPEIKHRIFKDERLREWLFSIVFKYHLFNLRSSDLIDAHKSEEIKSIAMEESSPVWQWYHEEFKEKNTYCTYKKKCLYDNFTAWEKNARMNKNSFYNEFLEVASDDGWRMTVGASRVYQTESRRGNACFYNDDLKAKGYEMNFDWHHLNGNIKINEGGWDINRKSSLTF